MLQLKSGLELHTKNDFLNNSESFSLLKATDSTHLTSTGHDQPACLCRLVIVCTVGYSVCTYFEIIP
jgi:hypothetical protein